MSTPIEDRFQVAAFQAHYKIAKRAGEHNLMAFAKAIAQSSDGETRKALERNPNAIRQWDAVDNSVR